MISKAFIVLGMGRSATSLIGKGLNLSGVDIGKKLLGAFENEIKKSGIRVIQVYTLSDIVSYHPYEATRSFYYQCGFYEYRRIQTNNPECPEELHLRKNLDSYES